MSHGRHGMHPSSFVFTKLIRAPFNSKLPHFLEFPSSAGFLGRRTISIIKIHQNQNRCSNRNGPWAGHQILRSTQFPEFVGSFGKRFELAQRQHLVSTCHMSSCYWFLWHKPQIGLTWMPRGSHVSVTFLSHSVQ